MAVKKQERKPDKRSKSDKPSLGARFKRFFTSLRGEIQKIMWPDRERLIQSTATVLMIILAFAFIIWAFDGVTRGVLHGVGFYTPKNAPITAPKGDPVPAQPLPSPNVPVANPTTAGVMPHHG